MANPIYQPNHKRWNQNLGNWTPNWEISEGIRPAQMLLPAPYLPVKRYDEPLKDYVVMSEGTPVALDSLGFVIPAGYSIQYQDVMTTVNAGTSINFGTSSATIALSRYTATDVTQKIKNMRGETVVADEPVIWSIWFSNNGITFTGNTVTKTAAQVTSANATAVLDMAQGAVGGLPTDAYRWYMDVTASTTLATAATYAKFYGDGNEGGNPVYGRYHNYKLQTAIALLTFGYVEIPVVILADMTALDTPPFGGLARGVQQTSITSSIFTPGAYVGYDRYSRYVRIDPYTVALDSAGVTPSGLFDAPTQTTDSDDTGIYVEGSLQTALENAELKRARIIGQCLWVDKYASFPKDYLDRVRTAYNLPGSSDFTSLDKMPGWANGGLPDNLAFAASTVDGDNLYGLARIKLLTNAA